MFQKGISGNPAGRRRKPKGTKSDELRDAFRDRVPAVMETIFSLAEAGEPFACRLVVERYFPALRPIDAPAALNLPASGSLADYGQAVMEAVAGGTLSPGDAGALLSGLGTLSRLVEAADFEQRLSAVEARERDRPAHWNLSIPPDFFSNHEATADEPD